MDANTLAVLEDHVPDSRPQRLLSICLINPRFEPSYWGFEFALPLYPGDKRSTMISGSLSAVAGLCGEHNVTLLDENVEDIDWESMRQYDIVGVTGMNVQKNRIREILIRLRELKVFSVAGGPFVTVDEGFFAGLCDVKFIGEAETTWPQFIDDYSRGLPTEVRYKQAQPTDMSQVPSPAIRPAKGRSLCVGRFAVFARLPFSMRILRHHRDLRPPPPRQAARAARGGVGRHAARRIPFGIHRRRQLHWR